jgi:hypothetical protein
MEAFSSGTRLKDTSVPTVPEQGDARIYEQSFELVLGFARSFCDHPPVVVHG